MRVVAGNHVLRAAAALGWTEVAALVIDIDDKKAKSYLAADNRASELGDFDDELLAKLLTDIAKNDTLEGTGYDQDDLDDLLSKMGAQRGYGHGDPDASKPLPAEPWVQPGQLFQIGDHQIICADGDDMAAIGRLLDGVKPDLLLMRPAADDSAPYGEMLSQFDAIKEQLRFDPWGTDLMDVLQSEHDGGSWLVWDKQSENTTQEGSGFSLIWSRQKHREEILRHTLIGAADGERAGGPDWTDRPTALYEALYERITRFDGSILDPYALGNTALLAADRSSRHWYGAKSDPAFVQSTLEKFKEYAGLEWEEIAE